MRFYFNFASKDGFDKDLKEYLSPDQIEFDDIFGNHFVWEVAGEMDYQFSEHTFCGRFKIDEIDDVTNDYRLGTSLSNESAAEILKNIEPSSLKFNVVDGNHELDYDFFEGSFEWGNDFRVELKKGEKTLDVLEDWSKIAENISDTTPDKIYKDYDNTPVSVAVLPERAKNLFDGIHDWNIYCGKAYFIDNVKNHQPELSADVFEDFQYNIDNFEKVFYDQKTRSVILCVKDNKKNYDLVIKPDMQNRILFCKYHNAAKHSKERYVEIDLDKLEKKLSVEVGNPSINHPDSEEPGLGRLLSALTDVSIVDEKNTDVNKYSPVKNINDLYKCFEDFPQLTEYLQEHIIADFKEHGLPLFKDKDNNYYMHDESDSLDEEYTLITAEGILNQERCWEDIVISSVAGERTEEELKDSIREIKSLEIFAENPKQYFLDRYHEGLENCRKQLEEESHYTSVFALESAAENLLEENIKVDEIPGYYIKYYHNRYYEQWTENLNRTAEKTQNDKDAEHLFSLIKKREEKLWQEEVKKNREDKPVFQNLDHHEKISLLQKDFRDKYVELSFELADEIVCRLDEYGFELNRSDNGQWYFTVASDSEEKNETVKCSLKDMVSHVLDINEKELEENVYEKDVAEHINSVITGLHDVCSNLGMDVSDVSVDRAFPEFVSGNFNAAKINYPKASEVVMYEEPRFNFNDNNFLLRIIKMADEKVYDDIIDYCKKNDCSVNDLYLDIGKSLRYDDLSESGRLYKNTVDWTKLSAEEQLDNLFMVRFCYGDDDGNLGYGPDEIKIEDESILKYLNKHIEKSVALNVKNYAEYRDFRNGLIKDELQKELHNSFQVIDKTPAKANGVRYTKRFQISSFTKDLEILCGFPHSEEESKKDYGCYYDANYDERGNLISVSGTYIFDSDLNENGEELNTKIYPAKDIMPSSILDIFDSFNKGCAISESYEIKNSLINITPEAVEKYNNSNPTYTIHSPYSFYEPRSTDEEQIEAVEKNYDSLGHADVMDNNIAELILDMANYESAFHFVIDKESGLFAEISKDGDILAVEDAMGMLSYLCDEFEYQLEKNPDNEVIRQAYNFYKYNSMNNTEVIKPYEHSEYSEKIARNILSKVENIKPEAVSEEHIHAFLDNLGIEDEAWLEVFTNEPGRYELHLEDGSILRTIPDIIAETAYQAESHFEGAGTGSLQEKDYRYIDSINTMIQSKASAFENVKKYISDFDKREFKTENIKDSLVSCLNYLTERSFDEKAMEIGISEEKLSDIVMDFVNAIDYVEKNYSAKHPTGEQFLHFISDDSKDFEYAMKGYELGKEYFNLDEHKATLLDTLVYSLSVFELEDVKKQASIDGIKLIDVSELNLPVNVIDSDEASFELIIDNENNRKILESMGIFKGTWEENLSPECKKMLSALEKFYNGMTTNEAFDRNVHTFHDMYVYECENEPSANAEEQIKFASDMFINCIAKFESHHEYRSEHADEVMRINRMVTDLILNDETVSRYKKSYPDLSNDKILDKMVERCSDLYRNKEYLLSKFIDGRFHFTWNDNLKFKYLPSNVLNFKKAENNRLTLDLKDNWNMPTNSLTLVFKLNPADGSGHEWYSIINDKVYCYDNPASAVAALINSDKGEDFYKNLETMKKEDIEKLLESDGIGRKDIDFIANETIKDTENEYYKNYRFDKVFRDEVDEIMLNHNEFNAQTLRGVISRQGIGEGRELLISDILESMGSKNANNFLSELDRIKTLEYLNKKLSVESYHIELANKSFEEIHYSSPFIEESGFVYKKILNLSKLPEETPEYNSDFGNIRIGNLIFKPSLSKGGPDNKTFIDFALAIREGTYEEVLPRVQISVPVSVLKESSSEYENRKALCNALKNGFKLDAFASDNSMYAKALMAVSGVYQFNKDFLEEKTQQCLELFGDLKSDMADYERTFPQMLEYVNENYPEWDSTQVLYNAVGRMCYALGHGDLSSGNDEIFGIEGYPYRCEVDDAAALYIFDHDSITDINELQNVMIDIADKRVREEIIPSDKELESNFRIRKAFELLIHVFPDDEAKKHIPEHDWETNDYINAFVITSFNKLFKDNPLYCLESDVWNNLTLKGDVLFKLPHDWEDVRTIVLGKDAALFGEKSFDFVRPTAKEMKEADTWDFRVLVTGYSIEEGDRAEWIEKFDQMTTFKNDESAAKQWSIDNNSRILEPDKDFKRETSKGEFISLRFYTDSEKNEKMFKDFGLLPETENSVTEKSQPVSKQTASGKEMNPSEVISKVSEEEFEKLLPQIFYDELTENMNNNKICHNSPFIAAREILRKYEKESTVKFDAVNRYLAEQGCTSEKGLKDFFIKLGVLKKTPEVEKEKTKKRDDDYDMSR